MRQHLRRAHPLEYNRELESRYEGEQATLEWTDEDYLLMAREEISYTGRFINKHLLAVFPGRNTDFIKNRRREKRYKDLISQLTSGQPLLNDILATISEADREAGAAMADVELVEESILEGPRDREDSNQSLNPLANEFVPLGQNNSNSIASFIYDYWHSKDGWTSQESDIYSLTQLINKDRHRERVREAVNNYLASEFYGPERAGKQKSRNTASSKAKPAPVFQNRNHERAFRYKRVQALYRKDRAALARGIIDDAPVADAGVCPDVHQVERSYIDIFGKESPADEEPILDKKEAYTISHPIVEQSVVEAILATKSNAAGPDGLRISDLRKTKVQKLVLLFNTMLLFGVTPPLLKESRTILIPKRGDLRDVENWRPITVSPILVRVFHRILGRRFADLPFHDHQRGFRRVDGVLLNNLTLQTLIKERRRGVKPYNILSLDLKKAFDSVSQCSILRAMNRFGIDDTTQRYIKDSFSNANTSIAVGNRYTKNIGLRRGVKQGDPLSPYLFNLVVDELIGELEDRKLGIPLSQNLKVAVLGYADDLVLLTESVRDANRQLKRVCDFFEKRGMVLNPLKCAAISVNVNRGNKHAYSITRSLFSAGGVALKQLQPDELFGYLGRRYGVMGQAQPTVGELKVQLERISKACLKPVQKINIIRTYLLPRYLDSLQSPTITLKTLHAADRTIRIAVRRFLHLNRTCSDAYLHAPIKEGGLGIMCLSQHIPAILKRRFVGMLSKADNTTAAALSLPYAERFWQKLSHWTRESGGSSSVIARLLGEKLEGSYSGNGLRQGRKQPASNDWVINPPPYWSGYDYIKAIQLRGNLLPTKGIPSNPPHERRCRMGCDRNESLSHVLQKCPAAHWPRIRRHDQIVTLVRRIAEKKGWIVDVEPRIRCTDGTLKVPDLVLQKGSRVVISDVAVSWEGPSPMALAAQNKAALYSGPMFMNAMQNRYPGRIFVMAPLIVGARGIWCEDNNILSNVLSLSRQDIRSIINKTIQGSISIHRHFMSLS